MASIFLIVHIALVIMCIMRILSRENLPSVTRLAWFFVIVSLPILGVAGYFMFGEVSLGAKYQKRHERVESRFQSLLTSHEASAPKSLERIAEGYKPSFSYAASINDFDVVSGNRVELLKSAAEARERLIADIDDASETIDVCYYIWLDDKTGLDMINALMRAAKRGVACRVMVDGLGSRDLIRSKHWQDLGESGVKTRVMFSIRHLFTTFVTGRLDIRNHRKICVIDQAITYCGSQNCADPEFRIKPKYAPWIDIMTRVRGPVVAQNLYLFEKDWWLHSDTIGSFSTQKHTTTDTMTGMDCQAVIWGDGPTERQSATPHLFCLLMGAAERKLFITTPYFVPSISVVESLCAAALRGVDVKLILPAKNDSWIVRAASRSFYRVLLESGVQIYEFEGGLLHSKILTVDGDVVLLGSTNLDLRSFDINYENNILFHDKVLTSQIDERQEQYMQSSYQVFLKDIDEWGFFKRIWNNIIATVGPLL